MYLYMPCGFALHVVERQVLIADANWHFTFWMCCLFESKVSEKFCRVLMACSHSDGESAPTLRYLITNQAALLQEPLPPPPNPGCREQRAARLVTLAQLLPSLLMCSCVLHICGDVPQASQNQWSKTEQVTPPAQLPLLPVLPISVNATTICPDAHVRNLGVLFDLSHKLLPTDLVFC